MSVSLQVNNTKKSRRSSHSSVEITKVDGHGLGRMCVRDREELYGKGSRQRVTFRIKPIAGSFSRIDRR